MLPAAIAGVGLLVDTAACVFRFLDCVACIQSWMQPVATDVTRCMVSQVPTNLENLENLELSGNFVNLEKSGKSQGICNMVREFFYEMSHFSRVAYV